MTLSANNRSSKTIPVTPVCTHSMSYNHSCHNPYSAISDLHTVCVLLIDCEGKFSSL